MCFLFYSACDLPCDACNRNGGGPMIHPKVEMYAGKKFSAHICIPCARKYGLDLIIANSISLQKELISVLFAFANWRNSRIYHNNVICEQCQGQSADFCGEYKFKFLVQGKELTQFIKIHLCNDCFNTLGMTKADIKSTRKENIVLYIKYTLAKLGGLFNE
jgi:sulfur relay (sulfurtransferase) complex TusBCD TusD component (DsrE family)